VRSFAAGVARWCARRADEEAAEGPAAPVDRRAALRRMIAAAFIVAAAEPEIEIIADQLLKYGGA